jgi:EAL domain-containing protein (putative c-di-GMP-specific phosphodiesterase class I)
MRWTHPARGPVSPTVFIPFAEQSGQIVELGRWGLQQACTDRKHWGRRASADVAMSVNVSAHQFMSAGFAESVQTVLADTSTGPASLMLEVTESVFVRDEKRARIVLGELTEIGVKLALDDFGTGYSSLGYLNELPIDTIKVDRSFVAKLSEEPSSTNVFTAIVGLAHGLGMTVVAEGVETDQERHEVSELGADRCQGFYFAKPMLASRVDALIRANGDAGAPRLPNAVTARI